ncbi:hypothetical protein EUX98_g2302 [Antrodiella citrinella]|uniref:Actin cytoskeleton-regulatory complex protein PAN1 n=1 Tax=Antrodiella citrinella TaxID=2447956 RepID=A0A4S4MZA1_9APHY|nr:hypothetical protein EUX98_g2302 [Antrodiella citrinella]
MGLQSQPTGFQPQPTGFQGGNFQQQRPPPVPQIPQQFQQNATGSYLGNPSPQVNRSFLSPSPAPLSAQATGFGGGAGGMRPLLPQQTGFIDPRLQMMASTFLPANPSLPYNSAGAPQLQQQPSVSLQQSFMQHNQNQRGSATPKIPWALSKAEKKNYDQIFRAWDRGEGFISGQTALDVFGQSGLDKNDLAKIWSLADADNRGKLNLAEFHVAMGLIYRCLNGNQLPDELPEELIPPSHRDLDTSVNFLKDILKHDTTSRARSPGYDAGPVSKLKERSFNSSSAPGAGGRQDATVYKYTDDSSPPGGFYQPRSRHVDRSAIRTASESNSPSADLDDMKRQLENTAKMLDRSASESASRTAEDEALEREMSDLKYRIKRVQEDLEYVSRGPRSTTKDEDRRRLERELLNLMHERVPELERKIADREVRKKREEREWDKERDRRNDRFGKFNDRDSYNSRYDRDDRDDYKSSYDRDRDERDRDRDRDYREKDRSEFDRDRPYSRGGGRERDYDRPSSPPVARTPPPPPPSAPPANSVARPPPPAPASSASPAANLKNMSPEQRKAFIQAEAQRRMQERMAALGVTTPGPSTKLDTSVEDRLAKEKKEAEEKAQAAERNAEERERLRRERLEGEKALKEGSPTTPTSSTPPSAPTPAAPPPAPKVVPPAPKSRAPAPPPPRKAPAVKPPVVARSPAAPPVPVAPPVVAAPPPPRVPPAVPEVDPEEEIFRAREAAVRRAREERMERLRQLEIEEAEAAKRLDEEIQARRQQATVSRTPVPPPAPVASAPPPAPPVVSPPVEAAPPPPPPPPPPVAPPAAATSSPAADKAKTNPFSRMMAEGSTPAAASPSSANGSTNPFFKGQPPAAATPIVPPPTKSPAPPAVKTAYHTAPADSEDDWDDIKEAEDDDDSEDELDSSRDTRNRLAQQLFGNIIPPSRPQSAAPGNAPGPSAPQTPSASTFSPPAPPPPPPSAPPAMMAPPAPAPAPGPPAGGAPAPPQTMSALLSSIQAGARLKKAQTNDRSGSALSGKVLGDTAPPPHINTAVSADPLSPPQSLSSLPLPPLVTGGDSSKSSNRDSVDWYAGLAADGGNSHEHMPSMAEEDEEPAAAPVPHIQVEDTADPLDDVDKSIQYRVRSLYAYEGQRPEDLSFGENVMIVASPSKSGGDWWHGTIVRDEKSGFFPNTYVEKVQSIEAKALYDYTGSNPDELPFQEGDSITIVDRTDADWWKAEKEGMVFIVPAAYLEVVEDAEDDDDYDTADESLDSEEEEEQEHMSEEQRKAEREVRAIERQRVLEAAGLVIKSNTGSQRRKPPARPIRARSFRRRAPPAIPKTASPEVIVKQLPSVPVDPEPEPEADQLFRVDDAFERYETYKKSNANMNRLSTVSLETSDTSSSLGGSPQVSMPQSPALSTSGQSASASGTESESLTHSLFHFFGRSRTPGDEARTRPVISAPILTKDPSSNNNNGTAPQDELDPGFGSSWASLVDKSALEEIPTVERKRQEAIFEFIATEAAYVRDLQLIVEVFYRNLLPILDEKAITVIFANVEDILLTNTTFLSSLEERQRDCRLYIDRIGDLLKSNMAHLSVYMDYCVNQANAAKVLQSLRESRPDLFAKLQQLRDDPSVRNLDLTSYLLVPSAFDVLKPSLLPTNMSSHD